MLVSACPIQNRRVNKSLSFVCVINISPVLFIYFSNSSFSLSLPLALKHTRLSGAGAIISNPSSFFIQDKNS